MEEKCVKPSFSSENYKTLLTELELTFSGPPGVCKQWFRGINEQCFGPLLSQARKSIRILGFPPISGNSRPTSWGANMFGYTAKIAPPSRNASATNISSRLASFSSVLLEASSKSASTACNGQLDNFACIQS